MRHYVPMLLFFPDKPIFWPFFARIIWHAVCIKLGSWFDRNRNPKIERKNDDDLYEKK